MDKKYTEDEAKVSACYILPFYTLKSLLLINTNIHSITTASRLNQAP